MIRLIFSFVILIFAAIAINAQEAAQERKRIVWYNLKSTVVEGKGWENPDDFYTRFPAKAESKINASVWSNSTYSSGIHSRFVTNSDTISVRWNLKNSYIARSNMAPVGTSGVDLYVRYQGKWRWMSIGKPSSRADENPMIGGLKPAESEGWQNEAIVVSGLPIEKREYCLYLPLYNGIYDMEIGITDGSTFEKAPPRTGGEKPLVVYGSSITMGASANRPGMVYTSILGRRFDIPVINLGFSGSGRCEPEVADLLAELDPKVYLIDCLPNMEASYTDERMRNLLKVLKQNHPNTPVVLVENHIYPNDIYFTNRPDRSTEKSAILKKIYDEVKQDWNGKLFYVKKDDLYGSDGEATTDGTHPSDLGFMRMADVIEPELAKALKAAEK